MRIVVQPTFPGRRRNSPRADTLCSDLSVGPLPTALFVADEAGITVTVDGGRPNCIRALVGIGADSEFSDQVCLIGAVPGLGMIEREYVVKLDGIVGGAVTNCAIAFAIGIAETVVDAQQSAELLVLDHRGETVVETSC